METMAEYVFRNGKKLKTGYTTGICAAAAARAAATMLLSGRLITEVEISWTAGPVRSASADSPDGTAGTQPLRSHVFRLEETVLEEGRAVCGVRKDAGDDADVTDGMLILAEARFAAENETAADPAFSESGRVPVRICGGEGIGRVTLPGLDQPVGEAAINSGPRRMIREAVRAAWDKHAAETEEDPSEGRLQETRLPAAGLVITISAPGGEKIAAKTFNPLLGIEGGISILGTTGIVDPMSGAAAEESVRTELRVKLSQRKGGAGIVLSPGNAGAAYAETELGIARDSIVLCSNYFGAAIDEACLLGAGRILLAGALGKMIKLAGGIFNTHSYESDARLDILMRCALQAGAEAAVLREMDRCITTEAALGILEAHGLEKQTAGIVCSRALDYVRRRCGRRGDAPDCQMVVLRNSGQYLAASAEAAQMAARIAGDSGRK